MYIDVVIVVASSFFRCLETVGPFDPAPPSIQQGRSWQLPCRLLEEMSSELRVDQSIYPLPYQNSAIAI